MGRVRPEHDIDVMEEAVDNFLVLAGIELFSFLAQLVWCCALDLGTEPGQLTPTVQRDVPYHVASQSAPQHSSVQLNHRITQSLRLEKTSKISWSNP